MPVSLEEYFRTTFEDKLLVKLPEREDEHLTPATRLLEKRREMTEVEQVTELLQLSNIPKSQFTFPCLNV